MFASYPVHPAAELFPLMTGDDLQSLADDIKAHGLRHPIVLIKGAILDGRNRLEACRLAGVEPLFRDFSGESPTDYVISANLRRRHLTTAQRSAVAAAAAPLYAAEGRKEMARGGAAPEGRGKVTLPSPQNEAARSTAKAARAIGAAPEGTKRMTGVAAKAPEVAAVVKDGKGTVADAQRTANLPAEARAAVVERVTNGTAATLKQALAAEPPATGRKDALGRPLPAEIADYFVEQTALYAVAANRATALVGDLKRLHEARFGAADRLRDQARIIGLEIRRGAPETACVYCKLLPDRLADCAHCKGTGVSSAAAFKSAIEVLRVGGTDAVVFSLLPTPDGEVPLVRVADVLAGRAK